MNRVEDIKFLDSTPHSPAAFKLSILLGVDSLLYGLWDGNQWVALRQMETDVPGESPRSLVNLRTWLEQEDFWNVPLSSVRIGFASPRFTLLPKRLFSLQHKRSYLQKLLPLGPSDLLQAEVIEWLGTAFVYALDNDLLRLFSTRFPTAVFSHTGAATLRHWIKRREEGARLHFSLLGHRLYLAVLEYENLLFFNAFRWEKPTDSLYYTSLAFEQSGLDRSKNPIFFSGMLEEQSALLNALRPYFAEIRPECAEYKTFLLSVL